MYAMTTPEQALALHLAAEQERLAAGRRWALARAAVVADRPVPPTRAGSRSTGLVAAARESTVAAAPARDVVSWARGLVGARGVVGRRPDPLCCAA